MDVTPALVEGDQDYASCLGLPLTTDCGVGKESILCEWKEVRSLCNDVLNMNREVDVIDASWMLHLLLWKTTEIVIRVLVCLSL